ncbi:protein lines isoform X2 [Chrysoperla carnea]|uniref:protein lines isoform X2 n=1 Tax=Chrysoperla carnea TaxID=189513 RepID=UPI001D092EDE|nr:protein lines isoform X2 [Chrysoperla carnea]
MVVNNFCKNMASDHPAKKKIRITTDSENENSDETDFTRDDSTNLLSLQLSLPTSETSCTKLNQDDNEPASSSSNESTRHFQFGASASTNFYIESNVRRISSPHRNFDFNHITQPLFSPSKACESAGETQTDDNRLQNIIPELKLLEEHLIKQCLCGVSEQTLRKPFQPQLNGNQQRLITLSEWPMSKIFHFLSCLHLLFDVYLKQNNKGFVCPRLLDVCTAIVHDEHHLIDQIFQLASVQNKIVNYLTIRVLSSYFIIAKSNVDTILVDNIIGYLSADNNKLNFSIEIIKRIVEWKDVDIHVLEEDQISSPGGEVAVAGSSFNQNSTPCRLIALTDHESFDTSQIKCLIIKKLETKWPELVKNIETLITHNLTNETEFCILNFLSLWESIISVRANLSVVETKPFYAHLEKFVSLLNFNLPILIWRQLLSLFNEVLCYGSTLALQDLLPEETCALAHLIVRYVKDFRLLDSLPYRRSQPVYPLIGISSNSSNQHDSNIDKTLLQKMVLLVLKSVAITVKETRSDSSDSSLGSDDYDFNQDMQLIERSIRDVLKKLDSFIKIALEFHPESLFTTMLIHLFSDQDDYMIESMVCTLDITVGIFYRNSVFPDLIVMLNPFNTFVEFLRIVSQDSDVLLDYLVSNETCFLLYLLRFLKYVRRNWSKFVYSCTESQFTMSVLIRLRLQINRLVSKQLFPYNISPVLRLLETCESMYEGNELT